MKKIDNEKILDVIYDLADNADMRIGEFIEKLEEEYGEAWIPEGIPEEIANELAEGRAAKKRERDAAKQSESESKAAEEIRRFREVFPDVKAENIPEEVWEAVSEGIPLAYAYALYKVESDGLSSYADEVNKRNSEKGAAAVSEGPTEPDYTKEQVENMSGKDVRRNYKGIVKAMKHWRFN